MAQQSLESSAYRKNVITLLKSKTGDNLSDIQLKDMEIGVYNWAVIEAGNRGIVRNWSNPKFQGTFCNK